MDRNQYGQRNDADQCEISVWDPNTANKTYSQPDVATNTPINPSNSYQTQQNAFLDSSSQSSDSWYDMSRQGESAGLTDNAWSTKYDSLPNQSYGPTSDNYGYSGSIAASTPYTNTQPNYLPYGAIPGNRGLPSAAYNTNTSSTGYDSSSSGSIGYGYNNSQRDGGQYNDKRSTTQNKSYSQNYSGYNQPQRSVQAHSSNPYSGVTVTLKQPNIHSNPLMDDDDDDEGEEALVNQMKVHAITGDGEAMPKGPQMLSKKALTLLKNDLDQAGEMFKSPELLKLARQADLGLLDVSKDDSALENDIKSVALTSNLSALAHSFVPAPVKRNNDNAVLMIEDFVSAIAVDPGEFHAQNSEIIDYFGSQSFTKTDISRMVAVVLSKAQMEENFKYLGAKFSNNLCQLDNMGSSFRSELLTILQQKYKEITNLIDSVNSDWQKIHAFIMVLAEFYSHLQINKQPIVVLGKKMIEMLTKALAKDFKINFFSTIKAIKLTGALLDSNEKTKEELNKMLDIIQKKGNDKADDLSAFVESNKTFIQGLVNLRKSNWGRRPSTNEVKSDITNQPETNDNYYMNEAVYFTQDGKQYTYADEEFRQDQLNEDFNPHDLVGSDEEELFDEGHEEEYDEDFENFLKESGQC